MRDIKFECPDCGQHLQCDVSYAGAAIACPSCSRPVTVPALRAPVALEVSPADLTRPPATPTHPRAPAAPMPPPPVAPSPDLMSVAKPPRRPLLSRLSPQAQFALVLGAVAIVGAGVFIAVRGFRSGESEDATSVSRTAVKQRAAGTDAKPATPPAAPADDKSVGAVANTFLAAVVAGDTKTAKAAAISNAKPDAVANFANFLREVGLIGKGTKFTLEAPTVRGEGASIAGTLAGGDDPLKFELTLKREAAGWHVASFGTKPGSESDGELPMTVQFDQHENPLAALTQGIEGALKSGFEEMTKGLGMGGQTPRTIPRAVSPDALQTGWKLDAVLDQTPARPLLEEFAKDIGLSVVAPGGGAALDGPISVTARQVSRAEAIVAVAKAGGLAPVFENGKVRLVDMAKGLPTAHSGPFVLQIVGPGDAARGSIARGFKARVFGFDLPEAVANQMREEQANLSIVELASAAARTDRDASGVSSSWSYFETTGRTIGFEQSFSSSDGAGARFARLVADLEVEMPAEVQQHRFETPAAGQSAKLGAGTVRIAEMAKADATQNGQSRDARSIKVSASGYSDQTNLDLVVIPLDAAGKPLAVSMSSGGGGGGQWDRTLFVEGNPQVIEVGVVVLAKQAFRFTLTNFAVPSGR